MQTWPRNKHKANVLLPELVEETQETLAWLKVVRVSDSYFWAESVPENSCATASCGASGAGGCQTNAFARLLSKSPLLKFPLPDAITLAVADEVLVAISGKQLLQLTIWGYGGALFALIVGVALGQWWGGDALALVLGLLMLLLSWIVLNRYFLTLNPQVREVKPSVEIVT